MHRATTSLPAPVSPVMRTFAVQRAARSMSWRSESIVRLPPRRGTDASGAEGLTSIQLYRLVLGARRVECRSESIDHLAPAVARILDGNFTWLVVRGTPNYQPLSTNHEPTLPRCYRLKLIPKPTYEMSS